MKKVLFIILFTLISFTFLLQKSNLYPKDTTVSAKYIIYSDKGLGKTVQPPLRYNGGDANSELKEVAGGCSGDSAKCWRYTYANKEGGWSGWYDNFKPEKDMSAFKYLKFYVKGAVGDEKFQVMIEDTAHNPTKYTVTATKTWEEISIPLDTFNEDLTLIVVPFNIAFSSDVTGVNVTVFIDYIRFE